MVRNRLLKTWLNLKIHISTGKKKKQMVDFVLPGMNHMTWVLARDPYGCLLQFCIKHSGEKQSEALPMCAFEKDGFARSSG